MSGLCVWGIPFVLSLMHSFLEQASLESRLYRNRLVIVNYIKYNQL